jgi:hypothetical protein
MFETKEQERGDFQNRISSDWSRATSKYVGSALERSMILIIFWFDLTRCKVNATIVSITEPHSYCKKINPLPLQLAAFFQLSLFCSFISDL